jgi:hypothetical protein
MNDAKRLDGDHGSMGVWRMSGRQITKADLNSIAVMKEHVCAEVVDGQTIVLDMRRGEYIGLDRVAGDMWNLLSLKNTLQETIDAIAGKYSVEMSRLEADLFHFVALLVKRGMVELSEK